MTAQQGFAPHIARIGNGPRPVLALHCTMAFSGAWAGFAKAAGPGYTFIAPDMPSHGRSPDWDEASDFSNTCYLAALSALSEPMDLIGHSFGGVLALRLALEHPDLVRSVTMIEPVFFHIAQQDAAGSVADHEAKATPFYQAMASGDRETGARLFNRMWSEDSPAWDSLPERHRAAMVRAVHVVPDTVDFIFNDCEAMAPRLGSAAMPALLIRGETGHPVIAATNAGIATRMPNALQAVIPGAGHMAPISHPEATARAWTDFLNQTR